jgi:hypothetical protein
VALTVVEPDTVAPDVGEVIDTVGTATALVVNVKSPLTACCPEALDFAR